MSTTSRTMYSVVRGVGALSVFYPVDFEHEPVAVEHTRETVLPDTEFLERPTRERFEVVTRVASLRFDHLV